MIYSTSRDKFHETSWGKRRFLIFYVDDSGNDGNNSDNGKQSNTNRINCTIWEQWIKQKSIPFAWLHFQANTFPKIIGSICVWAILQIKSRTIDDE